MKYKLQLILTALRNLEKENARDVYDLANLSDLEQENMSTESNPDPYQIEHTALGRKMLGHFNRR